jgi:aminotransferase
MIAAVTAAMEAGRNQYELPDGNFDLRQQVARTLATPADPLSELTITVGSTEGLTVALLSTVDPGDEVILFEPFYETFVSAIALAGGVPRFVPLHPPEWRWDPAELEAAFGPQTRAILLNTPNNPTGRVLDEHELGQIASLCERHDVNVISDEVYAGLVFGEHRHLSAADVPELRERSIVIGSLSKSHAMSGWRVGWMRAPAEVSAILRQVHVAVAGMTATPIQEGVARAAAEDPEFGRPSEDLHPQRERALEAFSALGARCIEPEGACYVMADITPITDEDDETYAYRLVKEARVLVTPGSFFYTDAREERSRFIRIAFNRPLELFDEVDSRLGAAFSASAPT